MKIADMVPLVSIEAPGCTAPLIERELIRSIRKWCADTWGWTVETTATVRAGRDKGKLRLQSDYEAVGIDTWDSEDTAYPPVLYRLNEVLSGFEATSDVDYSLEVAVQPALSVTEIPDWLWSQCEAAVVALTKHSLMLMPEKTWTNGQRAQVLWQMYEDETNAAKRQRNISRMRGVMRVRVPGV